MEGSESAGGKRTIISPKKNKRKTRLHTSKGRGKARLGEESNENNDSVATCKPLSQLRLSLVAFHFRKKRKVTVSLRSGKATDKM